MQRANGGRTETSRRQFLGTLGLGAGALALRPFWGAAQPTPIKAGVLAPLIFNFPIGVALNRGALIARDEINDAGGILGRPLELAVRDTQLVAGIATRRYQEVVTGENAVAVVGGFLDETTLPIVNNLVPRLETPFINTGTATPKTTELVRRDYPNFKFYFRIMLSTDVLTEDTVSAAQGLLVEQLGIDKVAIVAEDGSFGRDFEGFLAEKLPNSGMEVAVSFRFPQVGSFDFSNILAQTEKSGAKAFVVAFIRRNGLAFVRQWFDQGPRLPVIGVNVTGQAFEYWQDTQGKVISHTYAKAATGATEVTPRTIPFFRSYMQRFDSEPVQPLFTSYTTYDALFALKQAIERMGQPPPDPSRVEAYRRYKADLVGALEETDLVATVGRIRFQGPDGPRPHDPMLRDPETGEPLVVPKWVQWRADESGNPDRKVVWPPAFQNAAIAAPPEM